jgi:uncharacterized membrane protein
MSRPDDLSRPAHGPKLSIHYDPEAFGRFSESLARYLGTARFLVIQTCIVAVWIALNVAAVNLRWDPYPFILLNLMFSTQAAYAAPLILLAQNRQDERDRAQTAEDRRVAARTQADTEYLARELAALHLAIAELATTSDLNNAIDALGDSLAGAAEPAGPATADPDPPAGGSPP